MKKNCILLYGCMLVLALAISGAVSAAQKGQISHMVLVWLKEPGNQAMRNQFVAASRSLNDLPGIVNRHVGIVLPSDRNVVDDSFDVAVTVTLRDKAAFDAYMNNPKHKRVVAEKLKPLVGKIIVYDMVSE